MKPHNKLFPRTALVFALCISSGFAATASRENGIATAAAKTPADTMYLRNYFAAGGDVGDADENGGGADESLMTGNFDHQVPLQQHEFVPGENRQEKQFSSLYPNVPFPFAPATLQFSREFNAYSCLTRCSTRGHDFQLPCQCNAKCVEFGDCCADYQSTCFTCEGRCVEFNRGLPCQCNKACKRHNDCCNDYGSTCDNDDSVTDADLQTFSEALLSADTNNCANLVTVNQQGSTSFHSSRDNAPLPLLTVQPAAYTKPTIVKLLPLYNNYVATVGNAEVVTSQETQEETAFLDAILPTSVMRKAEKFLIDKGLISTRKRLANGSYRTNNRAFRDAIHQIWFGLYSRENRTLGSSGFEHVFLGEIKQEKVQGFHNWVFFSKEEQNNNLNYKGKIGPLVSLGNRGMIVKHKFDWISREKPISSMFVGTSPEFEIALYTVCFYARPGARCPVKLNGKNVNIQTHYSYRQGKRYVGSAFPDI